MSKQTWCCESIKWKHEYPFKVLMNTQTRWRRGAGHASVMPPWSATQTSRTSMPWNTRSIQMLKTNFWWVVIDILSYVHYACSRCSLANYIISSLNMHAFNRYWAFVCCCCFRIERTWRNVFLTARNFSIALKTFYELMLRVRIPHLA